MGAKRVYLSLGISIMMHFAVFSYLFFVDVEKEVLPVPVEIALHLENYPPPPPSPLPDSKEPLAAVPNSVVDRIRPRRRSRRILRGNSHQREGLPGLTASPSDDQNLQHSTSSIEEEMGPPRPPGLPPSSFFISPEPVEERQEGKGTEEEGPLITSEFRLRTEKKKVVPFITQIDANKTAGYPEPSHAGGDSMATGGGRVSVGGGFDFWSPPDYNKEKAKAEKKMGIAQGDFQEIKNTNRGHGVICNTEGSWFICKQEEIDACNATHDNLCRYARKKERAELEQPIFF